MTRMMNQAMVEVVVETIAVVLHLPLWHHHQLHEGRFTIDNEVSRLLGGLGETQRVQIVRGANLAVLGFRNGSLDESRALDSG